MASKQSLPIISIIVVTIARIKHRIDVLINQRACNIIISTTVFAAM